MATVGICSVWRFLRPRAWVLAVLTSVLLSGFGSPEGSAGTRRVGQCPEYVTRDEATRIAENYARQKGLEWLDAHTEASWFEPQWLFKFETSHGEPYEDISVAVSLNRMIVFCLLGTTPCHPGQDKSVARCVPPQNEWISEREALAAAEAFLDGTGIDYIPESIRVDFFERSSWSVYFLGSLRIGDHFSVEIAPDGSVLRLFGGL